jgi:hypothetical protein
MNAARAIRTVAATVVVGAAYAAAANPAPITRAPLAVLQSPNVPRPPPQNPKQLPGGTPHHEQYTALEFTVWTGDDDLRANSFAAVDVTAGNEAIECLLHAVDEDSWGNISKHQGHQCVFKTPKTWAQLRSASMVLRMKYDYSHFGPYQSLDNWNVNRVVITAIDTVDKHYPCLLDVHGAPQLIRISGANQSFDLTETENRC